MGDHGAVNIIGAGFAGLSAACLLAREGFSCRLFSVQPSERAQSVLAEGGLNAALDTMGEDDRPEEHYNDTLKGGVFLADPNAVKRLSEEAVRVAAWLQELGVPFHMKNGRVVLRNFGGQKKKRTLYSRSSTGKIMMTALIDEVRKYEASGLVERFPHHECVRVLIAGGSCFGVRIKDLYTGAVCDYPGKTILCCGGLTGIFPGMTTGSALNTGDLAACLFSEGVVFSNLEMIQYHPTTLGIPGKRLLVSEAARGEGGRLFVMRDGEPWYFMEEKYPELGNLMPRDVVSREMYFTARREDCGDTVYLDLTMLSDAAWEEKLKDLREELIHYFSIDPMTGPVPVQPGIHYFMGGIDVDIDHRTSINGLYAAGECCSQYHGANRLGGNSMLGALVGGHAAALNIINTEKAGDMPEADHLTGSGLYPVSPEDDPALAEASPVLVNRLSDILLEGLGIVRDGQSISAALEKVRAAAGENPDYNLREKNRLILAEAMLKSAGSRRESRGAHYRSDYPETDENFRRTSAACYEDGEVRIAFRSIPERRES
ncbi:MAG: FAD-binding protein [Lachnospiraceae bacterium]|nr:FAD-binding protein [Lachnospiraceae bacterium]